MKKILLYLIVCYSTISFAQETVFGGTPVKGLIPIKREVIQAATPDKQTEVTKTVTATESQRTGNSQ